MRVNAFPIRPLFDRVVVRLPPKIERTAGGVYVPESAQDRISYRATKDPPIQGVVVAVGPGGTAPDGRKLEMVLKVGDKVLMHNHPTVGCRHTSDKDTEEGLDGKQVPVVYLIVGQCDVLAVDQG